MPGTMQKTLDEMLPNWLASPHNAAAKKRQGAD
jgi:hypothetical protein